MKFREIVDSPCGIRFCFDSLELSSGFARKTLLDQEMFVREADILLSYEALRRYEQLVRTDRRSVEDLQFKLQGLREISSTLNSLEQGHVLDDIELYEIKHLAMLGSRICACLGERTTADLTLDYDKVIDVLDPDGLRIRTFYIYDSYSSELRDLRAKLEREPDNDELKLAIAAIEDEVKTGLSARLRPWAGELRRVMNALANLDILLAKAKLMVREGYVIPTFGSSCKIKGMFHPQVKDVLSRRAREFQAVDFEYSTGSTATVIGANMGGKTVALKTLCLIQYLCQFGFAVPAASACLEVFESIHFCIGDEQNEQKGLSSFAAEMLRINNVIVTTGRGLKLLALIDEPARTTNPVEGSALVSSLLKILNGKQNLALVITTHYKVTYAGQCWRVKGLIGGSAGMKMDYELVKSDSNDVPHEALNIARELKINDLWINEASFILNEDTL